MQDHRQLSLLKKVQPTISSWTKGFSAPVLTAENDYYSTILKIFPDNFQSRPQAIGQPGLKHLLLEIPTLECMT